MHRGPAPVKFADDVIRLNNDGDVEKVMEAKTSATFTTAGDYVLRAQVNDKSGDGGGGEQCCWTNALVKVTVSQTNRNDDGRSASVPHRPSTLP